MAAVAAATVVYRRVDVVVARHPSAHPRVRAGRRVRPGKRLPVRSPAAVLSVGRPRRGDRPAPRRPRSPRPKPLNGRRRGAYRDAALYRATPIGASVWRRLRRQWRRQMVGARRRCSGPDSRRRSAAGELREGLGAGAGGGDCVPAASAEPRPQPKDSFERPEAAGGYALGCGIGRVGGVAVAAASGGGGAPNSSRSAAATPPMEKKTG